MTGLLVVFVTLLFDSTLAVTHNISLFPRNYDSNSYACAILQGTNEERARYGLPTLVADKRLDIAAMKECQGLMQTKFLTHTADGEEVGTRDQQSGYKWMGAAENIYSESLSMDYSTERPVSSWIKSEGHHKNMVGDYTNMGSAVCDDGNNRYFVQEFGKSSPGDPSASANQYVCGGESSNPPPSSSAAAATASDASAATGAPVPTNTPSPYEAGIPYPKNGNSAATEGNINGSASAANAFASNNNNNNNSTNSANNNYTPTFKNNSTNNTSPTPTKVIPSAASRLFMSFGSLQLLAVILPLLFLL